MDLQELKTRRAELRSELRKLRRSCRGRTPTAEEERKLERLCDQIDDVDEALEELHGPPIKAERGDVPPDPDLSGPGDPSIGTPRHRSGAPAFHQRDSRPYSLVNIARAFQSGDRRLASVEQRVSDQIREIRGADPKGFFIPLSALLPEATRRRIERRDITKGTTGSALVGDDLVPQEFVELLRDEAVVGRAGARMMTDLLGDVSVPRQIAAGAAAWLATETTDVTPDTTFDTDELSLSPKTVGLRIDFTRRMMKQSAPSVEELVREDIRRQLALAIDLAALQGDGTGGSPTGIANITGVGAVDLTGGISWADVVELETDLAASNALVPGGRFAYVLSNSELGAVKTTLKDAGSGLFLMDSNGTMNGYPVFRKTDGPDVVFGNWAELLIGMWGGLDLFQDPYTLGDRGGMVMRGFQDIDIQVRHAASFSIGS